VIGLASYLFIELCPDNVVQEHRQKLRLSSQPQPVDIKDDDTVIDAEFKEKDKEE
jgi:hypothetical protein